MALGGESTGYKLRKTRHYPEYVSRELLRMELPVPQKTVKTGGNPTSASDWCFDHLERLV